MILRIIALNFPSLLRVNHAQKSKRIGRKIVNQSNFQFFNSSIIKKQYSCILRWTSQ